LLSLSLMCTRLPVGVRMASSLRNNKGGERRSGCESDRVESYNQPSDQQLGFHLPYLWLDPSWSWDITMDLPAKPKRERVRYAVRRGRDEMSCASLHRPPPSCHAPCNTHQTQCAAVTLASVSAMEKHSLLLPGAAAAALPVGVFPG
jgi:hypothetical protein